MNSFSSVVFQCLFCRNFVSFKNRDFKLDIKIEYVQHTIFSLFFCFVFFTAHAVSVSSVPVFSVTAPKYFAGVVGRPDAVMLLTVP